MVFTSILKWARLRYIQYAVTMSVYMLSPIEQIIFNILVLLIFGMIFVASYLYLPDHVAMVARRAAFYFLGNERSNGAVKAEL